MAVVGADSKWKPLNTFKERFTQLDGALNREDFRQLVQYERLRADRTGSRFTLVIIRLDFDGVTRSTYRRFLATLFIHMRDTDHAGWYNEGKIGILLPDTTISGAQTFIKNVHDSTNAFNIIKSVGVSMYPRVGNIKIVIEEIDEDSEYYSTYDKKLEGMFVQPLPIWKRALDITGSMLAFLLFLPLLIIIPLYILITSPGSLILVQERVGLGGHTFRLFKFRTMKPDNNPESLRQTLLNYLKDGDSIMEQENRDSRIIPGGCIIRALGLDALPQLWNILKGNMSLVGPHPCMPYEAELFLHWHKRRFDIVPGLTGLWLLKGKNRLSFKDMIRLDIRYTEMMSFWMDIGIILRSVPAIIFWAIRSGIEGWKRKGSTYIADSD